MSNTPRLFHASLVRPHRFFGQEPHGPFHCSVCYKAVDGEHLSCRLCGHGGHSTHIEVRGYPGGQGRAGQGRVPTVHRNRGALHIAPGSCMPTLCAKATLLLVLILLLSLCLEILIFRLPSDKVLCTINYKRKKQKPDSTHNTQHTTHNAPNTATLTHIHSLSRHVLMYSLVYASTAVPPFKYLLYL